MSKSIIAKCKIKEGKWEIFVIEYFIFITQNWEVEQTMIK